MSLRYEAMINRGFQLENTCLARKALKNTNSNKYHLLKSGKKNIPLKTGEGCVYECRFIYHRLRTTLNFKLGKMSASRTTYCENVCDTWRITKLQNKLWAVRQSATGEKHIWTTAFPSQTRSSPQIPLKYLDYMMNLNEFTVGRTLYLNL